MDTETPNQHQPDLLDDRFDGLLPERTAQADLFICDVADAVLKDITAVMEHPFYSLSKKPETTVRRYEHGDNWLEIIPSVKGRATIYDKDILIYCISQIMHKLNRGEKVSPRVRVNTHDFLLFTKRGQGGKDYVAMMESLERLRGTSIRTNIKTGDVEQGDIFGLIESASVRRKFGLDGRLLWCEIVLSEWVFNAIRANGVLALHPDYFRLRKPLERRIYELARKHCGQQSSWSISMENLLKKTGSQSPMKRFRQLVANLIKQDHLPDYHVELDRDRDVVIFRNRGTVKPHKSTLPDSGRFQARVYERAREAAPGWDVYGLESRWRAWMASSGMDKPKNPEAAFIGFCKGVFEREGRP